MSARTTDTAAVWTRLPNGLKLALMPQPGVGLVTAVLRLHFGDEHTLAGKAAVGELTGRLLKYGTDGIGADDVRARTSRAGGRLTLSGNAFTASMHVEAPSASFVELLTLGAALLRNPALDDADFEREKAAQLAQLDLEASDQYALGIAELRRLLNPRPANHVGYVPRLDEARAALGAVRVEDVRQFHRAFYGAQDGEMAIVGDFGSAEVERVVQQLFGGWLGSRPFVPLPASATRSGPATARVHVPGKRAAFVFATVRLEMGETHADYPAMLVANHLLGGRSNDRSRLRDRIRNREGAAYRVSSYVMDPMWGGQPNSLHIEATADSPHAERVAGWIREELERALQSGFTTDEVEAAKRSLVQQRRDRFGSQRNLATLLQNRLFQSQTLALDEALDRSILALSSGDVVAAMRRHVDLERLILVLAGDFPSDR